jgi:uncharacterized damage-inducible protein DinB
MARMGWRTRAKDPSGEGHDARDLGSTARHASRPSDDGFRADGSARLARLPPGNVGLEVAGLDDDALRRCPVPSSQLSLLGLVRHMAEVERHWFRRVVAAEEITHVWSSAWDFQAAFEVAEASGSKALAAWTAECERSRQIEASVETLDTDVEVPAWQSRATLRTILLHMIHEYARHNGHADLLREAVDGVTGT